MHRLVACSSELPAILGNLVHVLRSVFLVYNWPGTQGSCQEPLIRVQLLINLPDIVTKQYGRKQGLLSASLFPPSSAECLRRGLQQKKDLLDVHKCLSLYSCQLSLNQLSTLRIYQVVFCRSPVDARLCRNPGSVETQLQNA